MRLHVPLHAKLALLVALAAVACAGKSIDLDDSGQAGAMGGGGGGGGAGTPVTLVTAVEYEHFYEIAVDSQRLYWVTSGDPPDHSTVGPGTGVLLRSCLKDNCDKTHLTYATKVSDGSRWLRLMKVRSGTLYWVAYQDVTTAKQSIWACPVTGCSAPQLIVADAGAGGFELDASEIYFASPSGSGILACPISGCGTVRILPEWVGHEPLGLDNVDRPDFPTAAGDSLYWASKSGELTRLRKDGSLPPEALAIGLQVATAITANESYVYWPVPLLAGSIGRCAYPACAGGLQLFAPNLRRPTRLVIEGDALFFQHQLVTGDWQFASCSMAHCAEPRAFAPFTDGSLGSPETPMAVDEAWVYFRSYTSNPDRHRIQRLRR